ncbi:microfibril-associated glycoprotein 4-like [Astyanax mexicanus]|uniref:Microfibril-associated glycoprotein 4-like n=3 Tax=Astyanax mexicanus TaxID=7994 RepID=A0A8T2KVA0_ASTMX|nr:microfibril-associated glycoprotein 4-like [Astyanax mexicanus]KAG9262864.1 microfibril-associated glycoprotein 4-like [Astyanax mexicanus]
MSFSVMTRSFLALLLPLVVNSGPVLVSILPQDCDEITRNGTEQSGLYTIYPTRDSPVDVYCEMSCTDDQSGWTVFQRRMDGSVTFYRSWDSYKNGFGNKSGEYWLGLENLYQLTHKRNYQLRVDLEDFDGMKAYALYSSFSVDTEATGYLLRVNGFFNGGAGDALSYHSGQRFSTFDRDQDSASVNCARNYLGAFWYNSCHYANPNGMYLKGRDGSLFAVGDVWQQWKGYDYGLKSISMKIRPIY